MLNNLLLSTALRDRPPRHALSAVPRGDRRRQGLGRAAYFNPTFMPLMVPLMIAMAVGPLLAWKRGDLAGVSRLKLALAIAARHCRALVAQARRRSVGACAWRGGLGVRRHIRRAGGSYPAVPPPWATACAAPSACRAPLGHDHRPCRHGHRRRRHHRVRRLADRGDQFSGHPRRRT